MFATNNLGGVWGVWEERYVAIIKKFGINNTQQQSAKTCTIEFQTKALRRD